MNSERKFVPVMLTPFREDGTIDFEGLTRLTQFYIEHGAGGLFANCQSSEMFNLLPEERLALVSHVLKVADGKLPVVATGNFGDSVQEQAAFVRHIYALGVQAVILLTNQFVIQDAPESALEAAIRELFELTDEIPLGFYECPQPYKIILSPQLLGRLVATGRIIYHKDTCLNIDQVKEKNALCRDTAGFGLYDAYMVHAVESLKTGSAGLSCIQGNYFPELVVWLCTHYDNPDKAGAVERVQQFFADEMEVMHAHYPKSAKRFLQLRGLPITTFTRKSGDCTISAEVDMEMRSLKARYEQLLTEIM